MSVTDEVTGYKGMVCVDEQLTGIKMRLRKSMNKFKGPPVERPAIEIARAFERPGSCYLNRYVFRSCTSRLLFTATHFTLTGR